MSIFTPRSATFQRPKGLKSPRSPSRRAVQSTVDIRGNNSLHELVGRVIQKRKEVETYLASAVSRQRRLLNLTIIAGACASVLSAAPAAGGKPFMDWLTGTFGLSSPSWQIVCAAAAACSLTATIAMQLLKTRNLEEHVTHALGARATLEMVEVGIESGQLTHSEAWTEFRKCLASVTFIHDRLSHPSRPPVDGQP
jgi:hypothetical protein